MELEKKARDTGDNCVACTSCMVSCPVMTVNGEYRGPKIVGPAHNRMHYSDEDDFEATLRLCSNCKRCDITCPQGVSISTLNMLERAKYYKEHPEKHTSLDDALSHGNDMAKKLQNIPLGRLFANIGMRVGNMFGILGAMGLASKRSMPSYALTYFHEWFAKYSQTGKKTKQIVYFPGCYIDMHDPEVGKAFVKVMNANDIEVLYNDDFVCCGSPLSVGGYLDEARENAGINVELILKYAKKNIPVVTSCTSCGHMLKSEYTELFAQSEMEEAAKNVYGDFEYLRMLKESREIKLPKVKHEEKFIYHAPCHLLAQGIGLPAVEILQEMGIYIKNADAGCCGMAGNYGFRKENYDISVQIGQELFDKINTSGAERVICDCGTCREQIRHGTNVPTIHPIQLLAELYGL